MKAFALRALSVLSVIYPALLTAALHSEPHLSLSEAARKPIPVGNFDVTGEVTARTTYSFVLQDKTGRLDFRNWSPANWRIGDIVHVTRARYYDDAPAPIAHESAVIGHNTPAPPVEITPFDFGNPALDLANVRISGTVTDCFRDEIDPTYTFLVVERNNRRAIVTHYSNPAPPQQDFDSLFDAEISVTGLFYQKARGGRKYLDSAIFITDTNAIAITKRAPDDPFSRSELPNCKADTIYEALRTGHRCKVSGVVLATWGQRSFLLATDDGTKLRIHTRTDTDRPNPGEFLEVCGFPKASPFFIRLTNAVFRKSNRPAVLQDVCTNILPREVLVDRQGNKEIKPSFDGRLVTIRGLVIETVAQPEGDSITTLNCEEQRVQVITTGIPPPEQGALVDATGICLMTETSESDGRIFPRLTGFKLVTRSPADIRIVKGSPWWSPVKFLTVIGLLVLALIIISIWNRTLNKMVERRSREVLRKKVAVLNAESRREDRTRLAVELHDALSQNLAAVALQISSAKIARSRRNAEAASNHLDTAEKMLDSSRTELKNCLYDLRSDMLEEHDFETAVRKTVENVLGGARAEISFRIPRSRLDDITAHGVLMIVRELVSNAVRHGKADRLRIHGDFEDDELRFEVVDNGCGFCVDTAPGICEGHFGIEGIRQRISHFGGTVDVSSTIADGTSVSITIPIHKSQRAPSDAKRT